MRILHVINGLGTGGAERVLYRLATGPGDIEHEVICLNGRAWYSDKLEAHGIRVHHLDWSTAGASRTTSELFRLVRDSSADVVQSWMYRSNILAGLAAKLSGKPVVWNIRSSSLEPLRRGSRYLARLGGLLARWLPAYVINCAEASRKIHASLGYAAVPGSVIANGFDPGEFYPDNRSREEVRRELGLPADTFLIGCIGRWDPMKNFPVLCRAFSLAHAQGLPVRLALVGRNLDVDNPELTQLIVGCRPRELVLALGEREDIPRIARALDLHVLASASEGFPNVIAETMLSGTPNTATDVGDAALIVGETGWTVPPGDAEALANAIVAAHHEWATSPSGWERRRHAARQRIVDEFSLPRMTEAYERVWRTVAEARAQPALKPTAVQ